MFFTTILYINVYVEDSAISIVKSLTLQSVIAPAILLVGILIVSSLVIAFIKIIKENEYDFEIKLFGSEIIKRSKFFGKDNYDGLDSTNGNLLKVLSSGSSSGGSSFKGGGGRSSGRGASGKW